MQGWNKYGENERTKKFCFGKESIDVQTVRAGDTLLLLGESMPFHF